LQPVENSQVFMHWGTRSGQVEGGGGVDDWLAAGLATLVDEGAGLATLVDDPAGAAWDEDDGGADLDEAGGRAFDDVGVDAGGDGGWAGLQSKLTW
jgi:hypothetical protein